MRLVASKYAVYADEDTRRWQSKEFDGEHGKYYFGARFYDPFFGLWISPDPAGQFANPYSYGGDPLNYVDPTGMWAVGAGLVVSWDKQHGWGFGIGAAADFGKFGGNFSYMFNQDGSHSMSLGGNATIAIQTFFYLEINMGLGFSVNSYSGSTLSTHGGACIGEVGNCVGTETGGSIYWDRSGNFQGMTVYNELYAQFGGGLARVSTGYEAGLFGAEGRGVYVGGTVAGIHGELTHIEKGPGGVQGSLSFRGSVYYGSTDEGNDFGADGEHRKVSRLLWIPELGSLGRIKLGAAVDETDAGIRKAGEDAVLAMVKAKEGKDSKLYKALVKDYKSTQYKNADQLSPKMADRLNEWMLRNGMERVWRLNLLHPKEEKRTYRAEGSSTYGNIEIMYGNGYTYSSYNYANNSIDHLFLDMIGYWFSN